MKRMPKDGKRWAKRREVFRFAEAKGKTVETVELSLATDDHAISINFQDKTCLHFSLETGLSVKADYSDWKTGEQRMIRKWPAVQGLGIRREFRPQAIGDGTECRRQKSGVRSQE